MAESWSYYVAADGWVEREPLGAQALASFPWVVRVDLGGPFPMWHVAPATSTGDVKATLEALVGKPCGRGLYPELFVEAQAVLDVLRGEVLA